MRYKVIFFIFLTLVPILYLAVGQGAGDDVFIVIGGGPPGLALYEGGRYIGSETLGDAWPIYVMYDGFLWNDKLIVTTGEVGRWILIYHLPNLERPATAIKAPGNVSHFLYYNPDIAPLEGGVLHIAVFNTTAKRGYLCALDLIGELISSCVDVGVYPHAPIEYNGEIYVPLIREPYIVRMKDDVPNRLLVEWRLPSYVNSHDPLRYTWLSFHMITTDGKYIYGEGHVIEPGYRLAIELHAHSYLVALDGEGNVVAYYPTGALPPGLPGLAVCQGRLFATSPLEGLVYVLQTPNLKPLALMRIGTAPWGVFANPRCDRVYVTDILGGRVYVVDVNTLEVVEVIATPMQWPHTVIFISKDTVDLLKPVLKPYEKLPINAELPPPVLACGDLPPG